MRPLRITDGASVLGLQQEIQRSEESRYDHRLHGVLLVAQGLTCPEVARLLGDAPRSVEYWVHRYEQEGLAGLTEGVRPGRPGRLNERQIQEINRVLRAKPGDAGMRVNLWDGKTLSAWIEKAYGIQLGVRQCQRLFRQFDFRLRKPRPTCWRVRTRRGRRFIKKTPQADGRRRRGPLGTGRSALSAARIPVPDVGSAGNQGLGCLSSSDAQEHGLLCRRAVAGWPIADSARDWPIQRGILLGVPPSIPGGQSGRGSPRCGDQRQRAIPPVETPFGMASSDARVRLGLSAAVQPGIEPDRASLETDPPAVPAQSLFRLSGGVVEAVEEQFAAWTKPNETLRRLFAIT